MLDYATYGSGPGRLLLIAHGLFGSGRNWGVIAKRLSNERTVVAVDMRNHGNSPWFDTHSYPDLAADLAEVIADIGEPVDVIGHSMGGKAAMILALDSPKSVHNLLIGDIAPVAYGHDQSQFIAAMRAVDLEKVGRRSDAETQLAALGIETALISFFTQSLDVAGKRWRLNLDVLSEEMPKILGFPDRSDVFQGRTLFLSGGRSDYVLPAYRQTITGLFPKARFAKLNKAGHWLHADDPRGFETAARVFFDAASS